MLKISVPRQSMPTLGRYQTPSIQLATLITAGTTKRAGNSFQPRQSLRKAAAASGRTTKSVIHQNKKKRMRMGGLFG